MVRLIAALIVLAIVLLVRFVMWLARPKVPVPTYNLGAGPHGGFGPQQGFGPGYGSPPGYGPPLGGPASGYSAPPMAGYGASPAAGYGAPPAAGYGVPPFPAQAPGGAARVLARQDCTFDRLSAILAQAGLQLAGAPGPAAQPGEPASATWQSPTVQVRYWFDPSTYSRVLDLTGPQAEQLRHHLQAQVG